jgi:hypothetical protein
MKYKHNQAALRRVRIRSINVKMAIGYKITLNSMTSIRRRSRLAPI